MLPEKEQISALKKLSSLLAAGIPLVKAMEFADFPAEAISAVEKGTALSKAAGPFFYVKVLSFIRIGETGGDLASAASSAYKSLSASKEQKSAVVKALAYPVFVSLFGFVCVFFFSWYIIPQLKSVFVSMNIKPSPVLGFMESFAGGAAIFLAISTASFFAAQMFGKNRPFKILIEKIKVRLPFFSSLFKQTGAARALSDISCLLCAGLPLPQTLACVASCSDSILYEEALLRIKDSVEKGSRLSQTFAEESLFGSFISRMALVGEESGDLSSSLSAAAKIADEELQDKMGSFARAAEPAATIAVGVFAGLLVLSMLSPITSIMDQLR